MPRRADGGRQRAAARRACARRSAGGCRPSAPGPRRWRSWATTRRRSRSSARRSPGTMSGWCSFPACCSYDRLRKDPRAAAMLDRAGENAMSDASPRLSAALADRYRIERELGAGRHGHGVSRSGPQARSRRRDQGAAGPSSAAVIGAERFLRGDQDHRATAAPAHPPAASTRARPTGSLYYVMPFVEGESLRDRLASGEAASDRRRGAHRHAKWPTRSTTRIGTASSTATSSPRTSCCTTAGASWPTSASRSRCSAAAGEPDDRDRDVAGHAALHEPRAGDGRAGDHARAATSTRWAR